MNKTTLWHVGIKPLKDNWNLRGVFVSNKENGMYYYGSYMRIRTITPNAAGRKFIRGNLMSILSRLEESYSTDSVGLCKEWMGFPFEGVPVIVEKHL